jgi:hypothetical protein
MLRVPPQDVLPGDWVVVPHSGRVLLPDGREADVDAGDFAAAWPAKLASGVRGKLVQCRFALDIAEDDPMVVDNEPPRKRERSPSPTVDEPPPPAKRPRPAVRGAPWYVRLAKMSKPGSDNPYGVRICLPADASTVAQLGQYSLLIPAFTQRRDIPSTKSKQQQQAWLWNTYEHRRFFGVLDLDMDLDAVMEGRAPLFASGDAPPRVYDKVNDLKAAFKQRVAAGGLTLRALLAVCPPLAALHEAVAALVAALEQAGVDHVAFYSGGRGFRVLFHTPEVWRTVVWGEQYAPRIAQELLPAELRRVAPSLRPALLDRLLAACDKNVHDSDKGVKPDVLAHFSTHMWPRACHDLDAVLTTSGEDAALTAAITGFWTRVFAALPAMDDSPPPLLRGEVKDGRLLDLAEQPLELVGERTGLKKRLKTETSATHFVLQGTTSAYYCVRDVEALYERMAVQHHEGRVPLNVHELRVRGKEAQALTRHMIDYDGGPPLDVPLARLGAGAPPQTPLEALQEVHRTRVLLAGAEAPPGVIIVSPPRPDGATRAHLVWPGWLVAFPHDEQRVVAVLRQEMARRWPSYDWAKVLDCVSKSRLLYADKFDADRGEWEQRPLRLDGAFDARGARCSLTAADARWAEAETLARAALRLCALRANPADAAWQVPPLPLSPDLPTAVVPGTRLGGVGRDVTAAGLGAGVRAVLQRLLTELRTRHAKPGAQFYSESQLDYVRAGRTLRWGLLYHRQCAADKQHKNNNVRLWVFLDEDRWELRCYRDGCPRKKRAAPGWGEGRLTAEEGRMLRAAWPPNQ